MTKTEVDPLEAWLNDKAEEFEPLRERHLRWLGEFDVLDFSRDPGREFAVHLVDAESESIVPVFGWSRVRLHDGSVQIQPVFLVGGEPTVAQQYVSALSDIDSPAVWRVVTVDEELAIVFGDER